MSSSETSFIENNQSILKNSSVNQQGLKRSRVPLHKKTGSTTPSNKIIIQNFIIQEEDTPKTDEEGTFRARKPEEHYKQSLCKPFIFL